MKLTQSQKRELWRILVSALLLTVALTLSISLHPVWWLALLFYLPAFLLAGYKTFFTAIRNILRGQVFDEHFLLTVASVAAMILGEHAEAVGVLLFAAVGELFESCAIRSARRSVSALAKLCPDTVRLVDEAGNTREINADEAQIGDVFQVFAGERIPLDGVILSGEASMDCAALTGESLPVEVLAGDEVAAGTINLSGLLTVEALRPASQSGAARIVAMVEDAAAKKAKSEAFITKFARVYTPVVVLLAIVVAILPPLFVGGWTDWIFRALNFLVISCPCALVISVPLTFFGTVGGSARRGILFKDNRSIEVMSKASLVAFDKTGTLTKGELIFARINPFDCTEDELLTWVCAAEYGSTHPIAKAVAAVCPDGFDPARMEKSAELRGLGRGCIYEGQEIIVGNRNLMRSAGIVVPEEEAKETIIYVAVDDVYRGYITFVDEIKEESADAVKELHRLGVSTFMLSGDNRNGAERVATRLGITRYRWGLLPEEKVAILDQLSANRKGALVFVGDGINDAPSLARADVGIAMGGIGSDAAIEAADLVLVRDDPVKVAEAITISRKAMAIAVQNIIFAIGVKLAILVLAALGLASLWLAVFADVGVSILAILNSMRTLK